MVPKRLGITLLENSEKELAELRGSIGRGESRVEGTDGTAMPCSSRAALGLLASPLRPLSWLHFGELASTGQAGLSLAHHYSTLPPVCCPARGPD